MIYCNECGEKLEAHYEFCPECGARQPILTNEAGFTPTSTSTSTSTPTPTHAPKMTQTSPMTQPPTEQEAKIEWKKGAASLLSWIKRYRWICIGALAFLVILGGLYAAGAYLTDGNRLVAKFEQAVKDGDAEALASMLEPGDKNLVIDKDSVKPLIDYLKDDEFQRAAVTDKLRDQIKMLEKSENYQLYGSLFDDSIIQAKKSGKQFLLYNDYTLVVTPFYPYVSTTYEGTNILVNGKKIATSKEEYYGEKIGPIMPGKNVFKVKYEGDYASMEAEKTLTLSDAFGYYDVNLDLNGSYLSITSNYDDAAIFIDDQDTGLTTGDYENIGPILIDGSNQVHVEKEFPWGVVKSEVLPIDTEYIRLEINPENDEFREQIQTATQNFYQEMITSLNTGNVEETSHMSSSVKEAVSYLIEELQAENIVYQGKVNKIIFDMNSIELSGWGDTYRVSASVQAHLSESLGLSDDPSSNISEDTNLAQVCELSYENGQWVVTNFYDQYYFDDTNTEEVLL